jgi:hypothetical protein
MNKLHGVWQSTYTYSGGKSTHQLQVEDDEGSITAISLPNKEGSELQLRLDHKGNTLTGTWQETTAQDGTYKGATFYGALQLILNSDSTKAEGRWVGFNRNRTRVNEGSWILEKRLPAAM